MLVAGSGVFAQSDPEKAIEILRNAGMAGRGATTSV